MIGSSLNQYQITALIGAGGMGQVFRARDTRLNRDAAVKVLPKEFVADADRLRRFEQEAKTLAALNHPNVLTVFDAGVHEGAPYLVSELLEGKTLREVMNGGALPVRKATEYGLQIAHGLAAAHGKGIIHRDLKPENVFVTKDGRMKILDFGLAKLASVGARSAACQAEKVRDGVESVPTLRIDGDAIINSTEPGVVLGTPAYMSPEQVRGEPADHRADIFAFGCVLYEMLSGTRAFRRDTPVASMNAVLSEEPLPMSASNANIQPALERIVHRCLEKHPERRFQSSDDLAFAIEALAGVSISTQLISGAATRSRPIRAVPWAIAGLAILIAFGALFLQHRSNPAARSNSSAPGPVRKFEISIPPPAKKNAFQFQKGLALSPDGRKLAYVNADGLWVRALDRLDPPTLISSGDRISSPFWSPRSTDFGWFEDLSLKRAPAGGGDPTTICRITDKNAGHLPQAGGAWLQTGEILFATGNAGLFRVSADGGDPEVALAPAEDEVDFHEASAWPDGTSVIFVVHRKVGDDTIALWNSKDPKAGKKVLFQRSGLGIAYPVYSPSGHLLFMTHGPGLPVFALPIALATLQPTGELLRLSDGGEFPTVSADGTLALKSPLSRTRSIPRQMVWADRSGRISPPLTSAHDGLTTARFSPDDRFIAFTVDATLRRIWNLDLAANSAVPLPAADSEVNAHWLPNGREIAVGTWRKNGRFSIIRPVEGNAAGAIIGEGILRHLSPSGRYAFMQHLELATMAVSNLYVRISEDRSASIPTPLPAAAPNLVNKSSLRLSLSPDDTTLACESDETGRNEIWVVAFPGFTNRVLVSRGGGSAPLWSRDGRELFYLTEDRLALMSVPVLNQNDRKFGEPVKLFDLPASLLPEDPSDRMLCDVSRDGQRFLMLQNVPDPKAPTHGYDEKILIVQNWFEEFRQNK